MLFTLSQTRNTSIIVVCLLATFAGCKEENQGEKAYEVRVTTPLELPVAMPAIQPGAVRNYTFVHSVSGWSEAKDTPGELLTEWNGKVKVEFLEPTPDGGRRLVWTYHEVPQLHDGSALHVVNGIPLRVRLGADGLVADFENFAEVKSVWLTALAKRTNNLPMSPAVELTVSSIRDNIDRPQRFVRDYADELELFCMAHGRTYAYQTPQSRERKHFVAAESSYTSHETFELKAYLGRPPTTAVVQVSVRDDHDAVVKELEKKYGELPLSYKLLKSNMSIELDLATGLPKTCELSRLVLYNDKRDKSQLAHEHEPLGPFGEFKLYEVSKLTLEGRP